MALGPRVNGKWCHRGDGGMAEWVEETTTNSPRLAPGREDNGNDRRQRGSGGSATAKRRGGQRRSGHNEPNSGNGKGRGSLTAAQFDNEEDGRLGTWRFAPRNMARESYSSNVC